MSLDRWLEELDYEALSPEQRAEADAVLGGPEGYRSAAFLVRTILKNSAPHDPWPEELSSQVMERFSINAGARRMFWMFGSIAAAASLAALFYLALPKDRQPAIAFENLRRVAPKAPLPATEKNHITPQLSRALTPRTTATDLPESARATMAQEVVLSKSSKDKLYSFQEPDEETESAPDAGENLLPSRTAPGKALDLTTADSERNKAPASEGRKMSEKKEFRRAEYSASEMADFIWFECKENPQQDSCTRKKITDFILKGLSKEELEILPKSFELVLYIQFDGSILQTEVSKVNNSKVLLQLQERIRQMPPLVPTEKSFPVKKKKVERWKLEIRPPEF
ncbi:MAG: hypothetical protein N2050_08885 [Flavobacteriales bacterium]|nr:hypothetical protein [Flavobacteriales bacterium]